jgi:DNA mismatch endonuclease (patch repair protein)
VIFIDGCFWHGCDACYRKPSTNVVYWVAKVRRNKERDLQVNNLLESAGWHVIRIWEHEVVKDAAGSALRVVLAINSLTGGRSPVTP